MRRPVTLGGVVRFEFDAGKHPRDWHGRWASTGSAVESAKQAIAAKAGKAQLRELNDYDVGDYKANVLDPAYTYTPDQAKAINRYTEKSYGLINDAAREGKEGLLANDVAAISSAMQPFPDDLVLLREVKGQHALDDLSPGDVIADPGFSSTTLRPGRFAGGRSDSTVMHIYTPKGTPSVWANPVSGLPEDEVILDRDQRLVLMGKRPRAGRTDVTDMYFMAVPGSRDDAGGSDVRLQAA